MTRLRSQSSGPAAVKPRTKQLVAAAGAGLIAAAAVTVIGLGRADQSESMDRPAPSTSAAAAQTRASTSTFDDAAAERETQRRWGLKDIRVVTGAMNDVLSKYPSSDGGGTYHRDTLTFTQWIVETDDAAELRSALRTAFDTTAGESNLKLKFATAAKSINTLEQLGSDLSTAARNDDTWPRDLPLTGAPDLPTGTYRIDAGNRADDPDVIAYFDKHWPNQITLTNTQPAQPEGSGWLAENDKE